MSDGSWWITSRGHVHGSWLMDSRGHVRGSWWKVSRDHVLFRGASSGLGS